MSVDRAICEFRPIAFQAPAGLAALARMQRPACFDEKSPTGDRRTTPKRSRQSKKGN